MFINFYYWKLCNLNCVESYVPLLLQAESASDDAEDKQAGRSLMQPKVIGPEDSGSTVLTQGLIQ